MRDQSLEAQIDFSVGRHHRAGQHAKTEHHRRLALHGQQRVGHKAEDVLELRESISQFRRGFRRQGFEKSHAYSLRSEEHTSELQSLMRISYAVFCLKKKNNATTYTNKTQHRYTKRYRQ